MFRTLSIAPTSLVRLYATSSAPEVKASVKLIAEIRKIVAGTSLVKAREALQASNNDLQAALQWLEKDLVASGAAKSAKLAGRTAGEGLIATAILSGGGWDKQGRPLAVRAAMVELNCETDFVGRNEVFARLARGVAYSAAFLAEPGSTTNGLKDDAPMVPIEGEEAKSMMCVGEAVQDAVARLGEKVVLRRAWTLAQDPTGPSNTYGLGVTGYVHNPVTIPGGNGVISLQAGRIASLVKIGLRNGPSLEFGELGKSLAMQVVGVPALSIRGEGTEIKELGDSESTILYDQPFMVRGTDDSVGKVLKDSGGRVEVLEFNRWAVGEEVD